MRIVSLLPSATEIVCALGLQDKLVGVSHECDFPAGVAALPKLTRSRLSPQASSAEIDALVREQSVAGQPLYTLQSESLLRLQPDLILTQALCDVCAVDETAVLAVAQASPTDTRVVSLAATTFSEVYADIRRVALVCDVQAAGAALIDRLTARVEAIASRRRQQSARPKTVLLEWLDPPFCSGHWNPELIAMAGGEDVLGRVGQPSRRLNWAELQSAQPERLFIACCGFDQERTLHELRTLDWPPQCRDTPAWRMGRVYVLDGSAYFNRPGPRLIDSLEILAHTLFPELHPLPDGIPAALCFDSREVI